MGQPLELGLHDLHRYTRLLRVKRSILSFDYVVSALQDTHSCLVYGEEATECGELVDLLVQVFLPNNDLWWAVGINEDAFSLPCLDLAMQSAQHRGCSSLLLPYTTTAQALNEGYDWHQKTIAFPHLNACKTYLWGMGIKETLTSAQSQYCVSGLSSLLHVVSPAC